MEKLGTHNGVERRRYRRFNVELPTTVTHLTPRKTGTIRVTIHTETINASLNGMCVKVGFSDYIDIMRLIEAAKKKAAVRVEVEVVAEWKHFKTLGEIEWFRPEDQNHARIGMQLKGMEKDNKVTWNKILSTLNLASPRQIPHRMAKTISP
ncbi:MAG: hypothetical protein ACE5K2_02335 [Candidatus Zixiibacteriota bacterium]